MLLFSLPYLPLHFQVRLRGLGSIGGLLAYLSSGASLHPPIFFTRLLATLVRFRLYLVLLQRL